jgi:hypothetical protein
MLPKPLLKATPDFADESEAFLSSPPSPVSVATFDAIGSCPAESGGLLAGTGKAEALLGKGEDGASAVFGFV